MWQTGYRQHVVKADGSTARIIAATPESAQGRVNFPILRPRYLPPDIRMTETLVRLEAPPTDNSAVERGERPPDWTSANTCSFLSRFEGNGRRFRLKQFFYDWAPPACDHPPLWGSVVRAVPSVAPFMCWIGTDFMGRVGATSRINRTSVEMSVAEGSFTDAEIACIFSGLETACPQSARIVEGASAAELSYWSRHDLPIVDVPYGLFVLRRNDEAERCHWSGGAVVAPGFVQPRIDPRFGFTRDSTGIFGSESERELELIFTAPPARGREVRIIIQRGGAGRIAWPPKASSHPASGETITISGTEVHLRWIDPDIGPYAAVMEAHGMRAMVLTSSCCGHDRAWFEALLESMSWHGDG